MAGSFFCLSCKRFNNAVGYTVSSTFRPAGSRVQANAYFPLHGQQWKKNGDYPLFSAAFTKNGGCTLNWLTNSSLLLLIIPQQSLILTCLMGQTSEWTVPNRQRDARSRCSCADKQLRGDLPLSKLRRDKKSISETWKRCSIGNTSPKGRARCRAMSGCSSGGNGGSGCD